LGCRPRAGTTFCRIHAAAAEAGFTESEGELLVRSVLTAGIDTTVHAIGNALLLFAEDPDQWEVLRQDPARFARGAFEEAVRLESPVQIFFRTTTHPVLVGDVELGEGEKVILFLAAANRDPRRWTEPDRFDIRRAASGNVGFGAGIHVCVGRALARLEGEVILRTLAERVARIELTGEPRRQLNNTLRGLSSLPLRVSRL
jgi:cytochrome P450